MSINKSGVETKYQTKENSTATMGLAYKHRVIKDKIEKHCLDCMKGLTWDCLKENCILHSIMPYKNIGPEFDDIDKPEVKSE